MRFEKAMGVVHLIASDPRTVFEKRHRQLLTGIEAVAAPALGATLTVETLEGEEGRQKAELTVQHDIVGRSPRIIEVHRFITRVASAESTVLICGETGTGKELVARAIHRSSRRTDKPFVAINCATLTESLLESELFGHERGAFTGAVARKKGKLEEAQGGTVFLDEVGELAPALQAKLLRVLQEREIERIGSTRPIPVDFRLIAATNRDLAAEMARGAFRRDLFYRLNVVSVTTPSLRERRKDIPMLANYFAAQHARAATRPVAGISADAMAFLVEYDWPGNVRELENAIERAVVLGSTEIILPEDLPETLLEATAPAGVVRLEFHEAVKEAKREIVLNALDGAGGNCAEAARLLGLHPNNLHRLIRNLNLKPGLSRTTKRTWPCQLLPRA